MPLPERISGGIASSNCAADWSTLLGLRFQLKPPNKL